MTLNQVIKVFENFATAHKQINSFGFGDVWEIASSGTVNYPLMWTELQPSLIKRNVTEYKLRIILMDLVHKGEGNENEVLSDMMLIAQDVIDELKHPDYTFRYTDEEVAIEDFTERFDDEVTGVVFDVVIGVKRPSDRCAIPYDSINRNLGTSAAIVYSAAGAVLATLQPGESYTVTSSGSTITEIDGGDPSGSFSSINGLLDGCTP